MKIGVRVKLTEYKDLEPIGGGVYKVISPSGKVYIGQSVNLENRFYKYSKLRCERQPKLYSSLSKYGPENYEVEILEESFNIDYLNKMEMYYISLIKGDMLNMTLGGDGSTKLGNIICELLYGRNLNGESINKLSKTFNISSTTVIKLIERVGTPIVKSKEENIKAFVEFNKSRPDYMKGRRHTEETKLKLSITKKGKPGTWVGRKHSEESKLKLSNNRKLKFLIPEKAINHLGDTVDVIPKQFKKEKRISEWHVLCQRLFDQRRVQKYKEQKLKENN